MTDIELQGQDNSERPVSYSFVDNSVQNNTTYFYRLVGVSGQGNATEHGPVAATPPKTEISEFRLFPSFPNPFNGPTTIKFELPRSNETLMSVDLRIYNSLGQLVTMLIQDNLSGGAYEVQWNGQDSRGLEQASGMYFARMLVGNYAATQKLILLR